jgi:lantibiotic leader peptide-processing serine protease
MHGRFRVLLAALVVAVAFVAGGRAATSTGGGAAANYIVLYNSQALPSDAAATIRNAGGSYVYGYAQIGVVIAQSSSPSFRDNLLRDSRIENVSSTAGFATKLPDEQDAAAGPPPGDLQNAPASDSDSLSSLQWDMRQIHTPEAHAVTGGSPSVLVGDIDTGLDYTHPDLAANVDSADSVNCSNNGVPAAGAAAAMDDNGHGTHTAGTIAAASNGTGIVGVAPNVRIAGIKAGNADGFFFPEAVVCSFMWAASHHVNVTNNSYFADPYLFNCKNDPTQRGIWAAEARAILYAEQHGVTVVAADGNQSEDVAHPSVDRTSPDDTTPVTRVIHNNCAIVPVEVPGVIGVSGVGHNQQNPAGYLKAYYSSFGIGVTQLTAPGGDRRYGVNAEATNGRVLSTWPASLASGCSASLRIVEGNGGVYCYLQGTSMASPHVAGVAALVISRFGSRAGSGAQMASGQVSAFLTSTADPQPCPASLPTTNPIDGRAYLSFLGLDDRKVQSCQGGPAYNSWYGNGQVNAFSAVTH